MSLDRVQSVWGYTFANGPSPIAHGLHLPAALALSLPRESWPRSSARDARERTLHRGDREDMDVCWAR